tara:strand:- start:1586 stop:3340 length:1755 start_codon:yes stop_codon:yes gene_type:complete
MNLKELRTAIFAQTDWAPSQSTEAVSRLNGFINRAYNDVCLEAPFLFFESEVKFATQEDAASMQASDTISVAVTDINPAATKVNPWVFEQDIAADTAGYVAWKTDRSWDGRMIEIEVTSGGKTTTYRNRIRAVWKKTVVGRADHYRFSVVTPWPYEELGTGPFKYRVYSDHYYLPDDLVQMRSMRLFKDNRNWPLDVIGQEEAEAYSFADSPRVTAHGLPRTAFRREHFQLQGPAIAPDAELSPTGDPAPAEPWLGPEPAGKFEYVITYCWGKRDIMFRNPTMGYHLGYADQWKNEQQDFYTESYNVGAKEASQNRFREPLWESSPSPVSAQVTTTNIVEGTLPGPAVKLTLPNIEYMQGFMTVGAQGNPAGTTVPFRRNNYRESGWWVRIYRRRIVSDFNNYSNLSSYKGADIAASGAAITGLKKLDLPTAFFLLAEVKIDELNEGIFYDNGRIIPDYHRRLREIHGYQAVQLYPYPNERYEVDVRCVRRPPKLVDDQDAPLVHAEAVDLIIHRTLMFLYENMGNPEMAQLAKSRYQENLYTLSKRYGDLRPPAVPVLRRFGRARPGWDQRGMLKRWWTVKTP